MKSIVIFSILFGFTFGAAAQETGLAALKLLGRERGEVIAKTLVQVKGEAGDPQPVTWNITCLDATARGGLREYEITRGILVGERTPLRASSIAATAPLLSESKVKIDSDAAFQVVNKEAIRRRISFHTINYTLRTDPSSSEPVWQTRLFDNFGAHIVSVKVSAQSGNILEYSEVDPDARERARKSNANNGDGSREIGGLIGKVRDVGEETGQNVSKKVLRVIGNVQEFLTGDRTIGDEEE